MLINDNKLYEEWKMNPSQKKWRKIVQVTTGNIAIWPKGRITPIVIYNDKLELKKDIKR